MSPRINKTKSPVEIAFRRGFRKRTKQEIIDILNESLGKKHQNEKLNKIKLVKLVEKFKLISNPQSDQDWLAQYNEPGQTCVQFIRETPCEPKTELGKTKFIYYIQIDDFNSNQLNFENLIEYSRCFFNNESVKIMPLKLRLQKTQTQTLQHTEQVIKLKAQYEKKAKQVAWRFSPQTKHSQLKAPSLFSLLKKIKPRDAYCLIGFTETDLYADESDLFVAGLCDGSLRVGVFSCYRYNSALSYSDEFWFKTKINKKNPNPDSSQLLISRSVKLLVHETCHLLGFAHCVYMDCCMNGGLIRLVK